MKHNAIIMIATPESDAKIRKAERRKGARAKVAGKPRISCPWTGGLCGQWWLEGYDGKAEGNAQ